MSRLSISSLLCFALLLPSIATAEEAVLLEPARVRAEAGGDGRVLGRLLKGTTLEVKETNGEWAEIISGPHKGRFVARRLVRIKNEGLEANRELAESLAGGYLAERNPGAAERYLVSHLSKDPKHAKGYYLLGRAQVEQEKWADARRSFQAASELAEGRDKATYLHAMADASAREGDVEAARDQLSQAEQALSTVSGVSAHQLARMRNLVRAGSPLPELDLSSPEGRLPKRKITGFAALKSGYDSNVLLQADDVNAASSSGSILFSPSARFAYGAPILGGHFSANSFTSFTAYTKDTVRTSNNLYESLSLEWAPEASDSRFFDPVFGNRTDLSFVNSAGMEFYSVANTVYAGAVKKLNERNTLILDLPVGYQRFRKSLSIANAADNRSGFLLTPSLMLSHRAGEFTLNGGGSYSQVFALGDNYQTRGFTLLAGASRPLFWEMSGRLALAYTKSVYYRNPLNRRDNRYDLSMSVSRLLPFSPSWSASLEYLLSRNSSSVSTARYTRGASLLQVAYGF